MKKHIDKIKKTKVVKKVSTASSSSRRVPALLFAVIFAGLGVYILASTHAASVATFNLSPATSSAALGANFTVTVLVNSSTIAVNAAEADIDFDTSKLQFVSVSNATSNFDLPVEGALNPNVSGQVRVTNGDTTAGSGQQTFAVVTFKSIAAGSAAISVAGTSQIFTSADNTNIFTATGTTGSTVTITDTTPPTAPTSLTASGTAVTTTNLSWNASTDPGGSGVAGYNVYNGSTLLNTSGLVTSTSYAVTGLSPGTAYNFTVKAVDASGNISSASNIATVSTAADTTAPTAPGTLTASNITGAGAKLTWNASSDTGGSGVAGYNVYNGSTLVNTSGVVTGTTYNVTGLSQGVTYNFTVKAVDVSGNLSQASNAVQFTTVADVTPPTSPTSFTSPTKTNVSVSLSWTASTDTGGTGVAGYNVYRDGAKLNTSLVTATSYNDTGLTPGTTHTYKVEAIDVAGNVSASASNPTISVTLNIKAGDINSDNIININDLSVLATNFRKTSATRAMGDLNGDTVVDVADLSILASNWGK
jgi:chitodextrinase